MQSEKFLNSTTDGCSQENTFKSDVQSVLLSIIHQLLAKRKFELLLPTVRIWAIDVVDVVIFELGDKKVTKLPGLIFLQLNIVDVKFKKSSLSLQIREKHVLVASVKVKLHPQVFISLIIQHCFPTTRS